MNTIKILVVDDEAPIRMMLRQALVRHGFEVTEATDGQDALNKIADAMPDLLLLDWMMPGMTGINPALLWLWRRAVLLRFMLRIGLHWQRSGAVFF